MLYWFRNLRPGYDVLYWLFYWLSWGSFLFPLHFPLGDHMAFSRSRLFLFCWSNSKWRVYSKIHLISPSLILFIVIIQFKIIHSKQFEKLNIEKLYICYHKTGYKWDLDLPDENEALLSGCCGNAHGLMKFAGNSACYKFTWNMHCLQAD